MPSKCVLEREPMMSLGKVRRKAEQRKREGTDFKA